MSEIKKFGDLTDDIDHVLVSEEEIGDIVRRIGKEITERFKSDCENGIPLVVVCVLKGSLVFTADLVRSIELPVNLAFLRAQSYGKKTVSNGVVEVTMALGLGKKEITGANVVVVEDILDSGYTLSNILKYMSGLGARSVSLCVFLDKPERRKVDVDVDFCGRVIPDEFVVGYGLDFDDKYRNLPFVGVLKPDLYE